MEADVAIHPPDTWSTSDARFDQPEKVTYIYSSRRHRELGARGVARLHMKTSKSYDNELESLVGRETDLGSKTKIPKVKDDLSLNYGTGRVQMYPNVPEGQQVPGLSNISSAVPQRPRDRDREKEKGVDTVDVSLTSAHQQDKWKPKDKSKKSGRTRRRRAANSQTGGERRQNGGDLSSSVDPVSLDNTATPIPGDDQPTPAGPTYQYTRPNTLISSSSLFKDKPSSMVILEVKDGPTFFYRPSDRMVSDTAEGENSSVPLHTSSVPGHSSLRAHPQTVSSTVSERISSSILPSSYSSLGTSVDGSLFTAFYTTSSAAATSTSHSAAGAAMRSTSVDDSPRTRRTHTQLPRPTGLRKPDLSVLNTPPHSRGTTAREPRTAEPTVSSTGQGPVLMESSVELRNSGVPPASLPMSPTLTLPPPVEISPTVPQTSISIDTFVTQANYTEQGPTVTCVAPATAQPVAHTPPPEPATVQTSVVQPSFDNSGFENTSEKLQRRAGIKHDDIVVGPRRPKSVMLYDDIDKTPVGPKRNVASVNYEDSLSTDQTQVPATETATGPAVLSLSTDVLSTPILSLKSASFRVDTNVATPATGATEMPLEFDSGPTNDKSEGAKSGQTQKSQDSVVSDTKVIQVTDEPMTGKQEQTSITWNSPQETSATGSLKFRDKKSGLHRLKRLQKDDKSSVASGSASDISRSAMSDIGLRIPSDETTYNTKSLDRNLRSVDPTQMKSKSANSSPAKQQQQHQLHSPKTSSCIPTRKQPTNPKLHMLSNIPVPICHDPPAKRNSYYTSSPLPEAAETTVPSSAKDSPSVGDQERLQSQTQTCLETEETVKLCDVMPMNSAPPDIGHTASSDTQESATVKSSAIENVTDGAVLISETSEPELVSNDKDSIEMADATAIQATPPKADPQKTITDLPSASSTEAEEGLVENDTSDSPSHVPVKPRLHRSAEHLFGEAKLSIFNSSDNIQHFDSAEVSDKRIFQDSNKTEKPGGDKVGPLKKNQGLARVGVMRRGSDRTEMCRRGSDRAIVPISRHDPSVEDLKKATSLKELCQSVASLLNIDNERAAEMISISLSHRQDLLEGLDADPILDYLSHHGVLDPAILVGLDDKATIKQRNSTILKHVEEHGNTAVALFINALRQSGQLHLASSLDTEQRIKPVSGDGYFGKDRHKGEVTIRVEIEALKIIAPREPRLDKIVDTSLLATPIRNTSDGTDGVMVAEDEDVVKPRSCWCFCFSRKSSKAKSAAKKEAEKKKKSDISLQEPAPVTLPLTSMPENPAPDHQGIEKTDPHAKPHRTKSKEKVKKKKEKGVETAGSQSSRVKDQSKGKEKDSSKKSKGSKFRSKSSGKPAVPDVVDGSQCTPAVGLDSVPEVAFKAGGDEVVMFGNLSPAQKGAGDAAGTVSPGQPHQQVQHAQGRSLHHQPFNGLASSPDSNLQGHRPDKDNWDPIIMEYDPKLELVKLRAGQEELASPTRQSGNIGIMCEQWKSSGRHYLQKASLLCDRIIQLLQTEIIKYFEQDRGTLVLDVISDSSAILIVNICMKRAQVQRLQQEVSDESLLDKLQGMFFSKVDIHEFDIRGIKLRLVLDEQEVGAALSELS